MSSVFSRIRGRWRFDLLAAVVGLVLALALFPLRFIASQIFIETIPIVLGLACLVYLVATRWTDENTTYPALPGSIARLLPGLTLSIVAAMIVVGVTAEARTPLFHGLAIVAGASLFAQVLLSHPADFRPGLALVQVVVLAAVVRFVALYTTPGLIGIDAWTHVTLLADEIADAGSLSAIAGNKYFASPLYHLLVVAASLLYDAPPRAALYLSLGLAMPLAVVLVYSLSSLLVDRRWAVLAALLYSLGDYVIQWGIHLIPTSMGLVFYLAVLYFLTRIVRTNERGRDYLLLFLVSVAVILTHQVSAFIMLVTVAGALVIQLVMMLGLLSPPEQGRPLAYDGRKPVNLAGQFLFDLGFVTFMWSLTPYEGDSFLETVLAFLRETIASSAGFLNLASDTGSTAAGGGPPTFLEQLATYVDTLGFLLLLFATIVGCLYVLNRDHADQSVTTLLVATVAMLVFVLGLPMFGIRSFIPTRWYAFLYAPMAVLGAIGLRLAVGRLGVRTMLVGLLAFSLLFPGAMLLSSDATIENPVFEDERAELAYTQSELAGAEAVGDITGSPAASEIRPDQVVFTDHPYQTVIERRQSHPADVAVLNGSGPATHDVTVYRRAQSTEATFFSVNGSGSALDVDRYRICRPTQNVLYTNGDVVVCTAPQ